MTSASMTEKPRDKSLSVTAVFPAPIPPATDTRFTGTRYLEPVTRQSTLGVTYGYVHLGNVATGLWGETLARYLVRRLIMLIGVVFVITVGAFYLIHLLPGDPAAVILGTGDSPANKAKLYKQLGLNKPIIEQYWVWIKNILRGNLGTSFITGTSVWSTIKAALPIDVEMIIISQILAFAFAIPIAMRSARKPDGIVDRILGAGSFTLLSIPSFVLIVVFVLVIAIHLGVPHTGPASYVSLSADWITNFESL